MQEGPIFYADTPTPLRGFPKSFIENGTVPKIELFVKLVDALELNATTAVNFLPPYRQLYEQILKSQKEANHV